MNDEDLTSAGSFKMKALKFEALGEKENAKAAWRTAAIFQNKVRFGDRHEQTRNDLETIGLFIRAEERELARGVFEEMIRNNIGDKNG